MTEQQYDIRYNLNLDTTAVESQIQTIAQRVAQSIASATQTVGQAGMAGAGLAGQTFAAARMGASMFAGDVRAMAVAASPQALDARREAIFSGMGAMQEGQVAYRPGFVEAFKSAVNPSWVDVPEGVQPREYMPKLQGSFAERAGYGITAGAAVVAGFGAWGVGQAAGSRVGTGLAKGILGPESALAKVRKIPLLGTTSIAGAVTGLGVGFAASAIVESSIERVQNFRDFTEIMRSQGGGRIPGGARGISEAARGMVTMGETGDFSSEELKMVLSTGLQNKTLGASSSIREFQQKFKDTASTLKSIMTEMNLSIETGLNVMNAFSSVGVRNPGQIHHQTMRADLIARETGLQTTQVIGSGLRASGTLQAGGAGARAGFEMGMSNLEDIAAIGFGSGRGRKAIAGAGGAENAAATLAGFQSQLMGSQEMMPVWAYLSSEKGGIDRKKMAALRSGKVSMDEILAGGAGVLEDPAKFQRNLERMKAGMGSEDMLGALRGYTTAMAGGYGGVLPGGTSQREAMETYLMQKGLGGNTRDLILEQAFTSRATLEHRKMEAKRAQALDVTYNTMRDVPGMWERTKRGIGGVMDTVLFQPAITMYQGVSAGMGLLSQKLEEASGAVFLTSKDQSMLGNLFGGKVFGEISMQQGGAIQQVVQQSRLAQAGGVAAADLSGEERLAIGRALLGTDISAGDLGKGGAGLLERARKDKLTGADINRLLSNKRAKEALGGKGLTSVGKTGNIRLDLSGRETVDAAFVGSGLTDMLLMNNELQSVREMSVSDQGAYFGKTAGGKEAFTGQYDATLKTMYGNEQFMDRLQEFEALDANEKSATRFSDTGIDLRKGTAAERAGKAAALRGFLKSKGRSADDINRLLEGIGFGSLKQISQEAQGGIQSTTERYLQSMGRFTTSTSKFYKGVEREIITRAGVNEEQLASLAGATSEAGGGLEQLAKFTDISGSTREAFEKSFRENLKTNIFLQKTATNLGKGGDSTMLEFLWGQQKAGGRSGGRDEQLAIMREYDKSKSQLKTVQEIHREETKQKEAISKTAEYSERMAKGIESLVAIGQSVMPGTKLSKESPETGG